MTQFSKCGKFTLNSLIAKTFLPFWNLAELLSYLGKTRPWRKLKYRISRHFQKVAFFVSWVHRIMAWVYMFPIIVYLVLYRIWYSLYSRAWALTKLLSLLCICVMQRVLLILCIYEGRSYFRTQPFYHVGSWHKNAYGNLHIDIFPNG